MTFRRLNWGVSRHYRSSFPILGFASLSTDYAKIVQINHFITKILQPTLTSFYDDLIFSHLLIKVNKNFNVEIFCFLKDKIKSTKKKIERPRVRNLKTYVLARFKFLYKPKKSKYRFRFRIRNVFRLVLISRLKIFLNVFEVRLKCLMYFRLVNIDRPTASLYLNYTYLKLSERREPTPKAIIKTVKRDFRKMKVQGILIKFKGRFTRRQRAGKLKFMIGKIGVASVKTRLDFTQQTYTLKFGSANIKFAIAYAR